MDQKAIQEFQQLVDQKITSIIGSQAAYIARLEAQVTVMEKEINDLKLQIPRDSEVAEEPKNYPKAVKS